MKNTQRGITVIETLGALAIAAVLTMGLVSMIDSSVDDVKGQQTALHHELVVNAARKYIETNYMPLKGSTPIGTVTTITVAQLIAGGFLSSGFSTTNAFGQTPCVLVRRSSDLNFDALVATYGGQAIPERDIRLTAMLAGQGGGYISTTAPGTARGASWELVTTDYLDKECNGTKVLTGAAAHDGGHLVSALFYDGPGQLSTDFLYRDAVPGRPELNRMNTPIAMAGAAIVTRGAACGSEAALGIENATRHLLVCGTDGLWMEISNWRSPVPTHAALPGTGNSIGDVRIVKDLNRAFTYGESGWTALAVDEKGDMLMSGKLTVGNVDATDSIIAAKNLTAGKTVKGTTVQAGWITAEYWLETSAAYISGDRPTGVTGIVTAGDPCHTTNPDGTIDEAVGTIRRDARGVILTCFFDGGNFSYRYQDGGVTPPW